jgi:hypothetical protein
MEISEQIRQRRADAGPSREEPTVCPFVIYEQRISEQKFEKQENN